MTEQSPPPEESAGATSPEPARLRERDEERARAKRGDARPLSIVVSGPRPALPVSVTMPRTPEELFSVLSLLLPMPHERWDELAERTNWLVSVGCLCADLNAEPTAEFGGFTSPDGAWCAVVLWTTPPVLVMEQPFRVADEPPPMPTRPILGPNGERIR